MKERNEVAGIEQNASVGGAHDEPSPLLEPPLAGDVPWDSDHERPALAPRTDAQPDTKPPSRGMLYHDSKIVRARLIASSNPRVRRRTIARSSINGMRPAELVVIFATSR